MLAVQVPPRTFDSFVYSGRDLKRHKAIYPEPAGSSYAKVKEQYYYLIRTVFDGKGNCIIKIVLDITQLTITIEPL